MWTPGDFGLRQCGGGGDGESRSAGVGGGVHQRGMRLRATNEGSRLTPLPHPARDDLGADDWVSVKRHPDDSRRG